MNFTTYEERYHDAWIPGYDPSHVYHDPNVYEWLLRQHRAPSEDTPGEDPVTALEQKMDAESPSFSIHPNPATDRVTWSLNGEGAVTIRSVTGSVIRTVDVRSQGIDLSDVQPGVYLLQLEGAAGVIATRRLAIVR
jgi:hypothetical protein